MNQVGPLCLNWEDFLGNSAVAAAYDNLKKLTSKRIALHSRTLCPGIKNAGWAASRDAIHVVVGERAPLASHSIVHELIHAILMEEGYYRLTWNQNSQTRGALSNELQHPEVFRRMSEYGLDMQPYWLFWELELSRGLPRFTGDKADQQHFNFLQVFTWFFFREASSPHLKVFHSFDPSLYHAAKAAHDEAIVVGCSTPEKHLEYLAIFRTHWLQFCIHNLRNNDLRQTVIDGIRESRPRRVSEIIDSFSEDLVVDHLTRNEV